MNARLIATLPVLLLFATSSSAQVFGRVFPAGVADQNAGRYTVIHDSVGHYELNFPGMAPSKRTCVISPIGAPVYIAKLVHTRTGCAFTFRNAKTKLPQNAGFSFIEGLRS